MWNMLFMIHALQNHQMTLSERILWLTCFPTAPITPPPGCALLPHSQIPPTFPLTLLEKRLSSPMLPWKMFPSVRPSRFSRSKGVRISMQCMSSGSQRYSLICSRKTRLMSSWGMGETGSALLGWQGVYCMKQFMMWQPFGQRVLSYTEGIVRSMKGVLLMRWRLVWLYASISMSIEQEFTWMVPLRSCQGESECPAKALNFGNFLNAKLIFVAAPLYSIFLSLLNTFFGRYLSEFLTKLKKVTLLVQLLRIAFDSMVQPLAKRTATGLFVPSYKIYSTLALTLTCAPRSVAFFAKISDSLPLPPSTQPHYPFLPSYNSPITWCSSTQAVVACAIDKFSPMMPSVARVAFNISLQNQLSSISLTDEVTNFPNQKQSRPGWQARCRKLILSAREGLLRQLQGRCSKFLSQKSQNPLRYASYLFHCSASFWLNLAISAFVFCESWQKRRYSPAFLVGVSEGISLQCIFSPFCSRPRSLMIPFLKSERTQEQRENLNPGMSSSVSAAPPTTWRCSSTKTFFLAMARQLAATRPLWPAPMTMASYAWVSFFINSPN